MIFKLMKLPSDYKFGLIFGIFFLILSIFFYIKKFNGFYYVSGSTSIIFFMIALIKPSILRPINRLWMALGFFLGTIVNPIVMGVIFFLLFSPIGIIMRLFGRDVLFIKLKKKPSYWEKYNELGSLKDPF